MGLIGNYIAVNESFINEVLDETISLLDLEEDEENGYIDIDKSWGGLQYVLQQAAESASNHLDLALPMVEEKHLEIEGEDFDAFSLTASEVKEVNELLQNFHEEDFKKHYDLKAMINEEVYPFSKADENEEEEVYDYLSFYLTEIKDFFREAAEKNQAVVFYIM